MPTITSIKPQKGKGRYNIYIDGKFAFGVDEDTMVKEQLKVGKEISEWELERLVEESEVGKLYQKALRFLEYRPRSEREVRDYLNRRLGSQRAPARGGQAEEAEGTEREQIVDSIIKRLKGANYINDEEFAHWWVKQRREHRPRGKILLRQELYQKGIERKIIDIVIQGYSDTTEVELATKAAQKKLGAYKNLNPREFKQKMGQFLARRGFEWEVIKETVDNFLSKR